jgi:hypothetical protein
MIMGYTFQQRVLTWISTCFEPKIVFSVKERNYRFLEESLELVQSLGCTSGEAHQLVEYVYNRPEGNPAQEVGGVLICLAALCTASKIEMDAAGEAELTRVWTSIDKIKAKHANKPDALKDFPIRKFAEGVEFSGCPHCGYRHPPDGVCLAS